ncbi:acetolactate decarboxylase [Salidesulfovibrio brasiliensis]
MKRIVLALCLSLFMAASAVAGELFQYSTIDALLAGLYDGRLTVGELLERGGFGLGTLNGLDGELVVLDGKAYHVKAGGEATVLKDNALVPFAAVTDFSEDSIASLDDIPDIKALNAAVGKHLSSGNFFHAIRIDGRFEMLKTRAIPAQTPPYRPLAEVVKEQVIVKLTSTEGTLVGIWTPGYMKGVSVPGFHWHFLSKDGTTGGHVLDVSFKGLVARVDTMRDFSMRLPEALGTLDLGADRKEELEKVEMNPAE